VYVWKTGEGAVGHVLIDTEEAVARPCTPQGIVVGDMLLREGVGNIEQPDSDPEVRRCFLIAASVIFQEWRRQGLLPEEITRTYW
ncbi:hypothetical protein NGM37_53885, partial [Streptomyces sp. TRM76130]|nr:hypothetical protein [Streptomyces sp. TRM76130]